MNQPLFCISEIQQFCKNDVENNQIPHRHDYYSVYWIQKGEAIHSTNFIDYNISANSIFFVPPDLVHRMDLQPDTTGYSILFNKSFFKHESLPENILSSTLFNNPEFYTIIKLNDYEILIFEKIIKNLLAEHLSQMNYKNEIIQNLLLIFLFQSKRIHETQYKESTIDDCPKSLVIEFKKLIENYFREFKEVSFYAKKLNIRPANLNENVKRITGFTAGEIIRNKIIEEIKRLLYSTDLTTKQIAYQLGFDDPAYFSRFFKKYTNQTLLEFRENIRKKYQNKIIL